MRTYKVTYTEKLVHEFYVDAENLDEASEKFYSQLNHGEVDFSYGCLADSDIKIEDTEDEDFWEEPDWDDEECEIDRLYQDASEDELRKMGAFDNLHDDEYVPSAENGDYSPSNPWDAPGMKISDFI